MSKVRPIPLDEEPPHIEAPPGTELIVEVEGVYGHLKSELLGYKKGHFLIMRTPVGPPGFGTKLFRGNTITVRYLTEGRAYGFQSTITGAITDPEPVLFIRCPSVVQERSLRAAPRLDIYTVCKVAVQNHTVDGTIIDISRAGCRCVVASHMHEGVLHPHMGDHIVIAAEMEDGPIKLTGVIKNVAGFAASVRIGVLFQGMEESVEQRILALLVREGVEA